MRWKDECKLVPRWMLVQQLDDHQQDRRVVIVGSVEVEEDEAPTRVLDLQRTRSNTTTNPLEVSCTRLVTATAAARDSGTDMSSVMTHMYASALFMPCGEQELGGWLTLGAEAELKFPATSCHALM